MIWILKRHDRRYELKLSDSNFVDTSEMWYPQWQHGHYTQFLIMAKWNEFHDFRESDFLNYSRFGVGRGFICGLATIDGRLRCPSNKVSGCLYFFLLVFMSSKPRRSILSRMSIRKTVVLLVMKCVDTTCPTYSSCELLPHLGTDMIAPDSGTHWSDKVSIFLSSLLWL